MKPVCSLRFVASQTVAEEDSFSGSHLAAPSRPASSTRLWRWCGLLLLGLALTAWTNQDARAQNAPPVLVNPIPDVGMAVGDPPYVVGHVSQFFSDPDGDLLFVTARPENRQVAGVDAARLGNEGILEVILNPDGTAGRRSPSPPSIRSAGAR